MKLIKESDSATTIPAYPMKLVLFGARSMRGNLGFTGKNYKNYYSLDCDTDESQDNNSKGDLVYLASLEKSFLAVTGGGRTVSE